MSQVGRVGHIVLAVARAALVRHLADVGQERGDDHGVGDERCRVNAQL